MNYELNIEKVISKIKDKKAKTVCIQLPDGLKPKAKDIQEQIESNTKAKVIIWSGSCFGACDTPTEISKLGIDLLIQWGHSRWK